MSNINSRKEKRKEMQSLREHDCGNISEISQKRRDTIRSQIWFELQNRYSDIFNEYEEMYVTGSWARGEAIYGMSDLDIVIVSDNTDSLDMDIIDDIREYFKIEFTMNHCNNDPWLFIDLWVQWKPPEHSVIL